MSKWLVAITVMLPTLIEIVDTSVVNVSLDHIRGSLSAGIDEATWAITAYLVSNAIIIPMSGWLSRLFGRKRYLMFSLGLFTASSFLCGISWNMASLVTFRVLQGIGGGGLQPISQAILLETFPRKQHGMAMAIFGIGVMFGPIIGPLLGGWITDNWSWHWIFFINVPIGVVSILMALLVIQDPPYLRRKGMRIDYAGLALLAIGLGSLQFVLDKGQREDWFGSQVIVWMSLISAFSLVLFVVNEYYAEHPIVPLRIFKNATFATANVVMFVVFFGLFGSIVLLPLYLQQLMGYTAFLAGLVLGPGGFATMLVMPIAGILITRINPKFILAFGIAVTSYSVYLMGHLNLTADFYAVAWPRVVLGIGMGAVFVPLTTLAMSRIPKEEMGTGTAVYNLLRNLGGSFGVAFATTLLARRMQFHQLRLGEHLTAFDRNLQTAMPQAAQALRLKGVGSPLPLPNAPTSGLFYQRLLQQAAVMSFNDVFFVLFILILCSLALVLIMRRGESHELPLAA